MDRILKNMKALLCGMGLCLTLVGAQAGLYDINLNSTNEGGFLSGAYEATPNASTATGGEVGIGLSYDTGLGVLNVNLAYGLFGFTPLQANYTASHIHVGAPGVAGPVLINLAPLHTALGSMAGIYTGTVAFSPVWETDLFSGNLYVNIHSTAYPAGEIRAQLIPVTVPEPGTWGIISAGLLALGLFQRRKA